MEARKWKPGQPSPNPHGRPRTKLLSEAYRLVLADLEEGGDRSVAEAIAQAMARKAMKGNIPAARELADRTEGKAVQAVRIEPEMDEATALRLFDLYEEMFGERPSLAVADAPALPPGEAVNKLLE
jgi:hypothetical protein